MIFEKVQELLAEQLSCDPDEITMDSELKEELGADSLDAVELAMALEEEYDIELQDEDLDRFKTVGDIVEFLREKLDE